MIACGALGAHVREIIARRRWPVEVHTLPAPLHNRPQKITPWAERVAPDALAHGHRVAVAYADCGTYGALDDLCARLGLRRLAGLHCYDVFAGPDRVRELFEAEPGTYLLTDFLVRSFDRTVLAGLGLDRYPELWPDYFGHYRRVVWLAQDRTAELEAEAERVAARFGLPLTVVETGLARLESELERLVAALPARPPVTPPRHAARSASRSSDARSRSAVVARARAEALRIGQLGPVVGAGDPGGRRAARLEFPAPQVPRRRLAPPRRAATPSGGPPRTRPRGSPGPHRGSASS